MGAGGLRAEAATRVAQLRALPPSSSSSSPAPTALQSEHLPSLSDVVSEAALRDLPACVQRYFHWTGVVGRKRSRVVHLTQQFRIRQSASSQWVDGDAEQVMTEQALVWVASFMRLPLLGWPLGCVVDEYVAGRGHSRGTMGPFSLFDFTGQQIDQSCVGRLMAEQLLWLPCALLPPNAEWTAEGNDPLCARVALVGLPVRVSMVVTFAADGAPVRVRVLRWRAEQCSAAEAEAAVASGGALPMSLTAAPLDTPLTSVAPHASDPRQCFTASVFRGEVLATGEMEGVRVATRASGVWEPRHGRDSELEYFQCQLTDLHFDQWPTLH